MKKIIIFVCFLILTSVLVYSEEPDCSDITCPDGWDSGETGWITLQLNDSNSCSGKICYCYNLDTLANEGPCFFLKGIIWKNDSCYIKHYFNVDKDFFKENVMRELIRIHQDVLPLRFCPQYWSGAELYTSWCYAAKIHKETGFVIWMACLGEGYCVRHFMYCWDKTKTPWELDVVNYGMDMYYDTGECILPFVIGPDYEFLHGCIPWCNEQ